MPERDPALALWNKGSSALARDKHGQSPILLAERGAPQIVLMFMEGEEERQALMMPSLRAEALSRMPEEKGSKRSRPVSKRWIWSAGSKKEGWRVDWGQKEGFEKDRTEKGRKNRPAIGKKEAAILIGFGADKRARTKKKEEL